MEVRKLFPREVAPGARFAGIRCVDAWSFYHVIEMRSSVFAEVVAGMGHFHFVSAL
jgi:hypothetical protein